MRRQPKEFNLTSYNDLIGLTEDAPKAFGNDLQVVRIPLINMHEFAGHPFRVVQDKKMAEMVTSIKQYGVLVPAIVRPHKVHIGEYEIVAGHCRHCASGLAGLDDMPVIVRDLSDDEATVIMVDSNIQREDLLPSEKARAYRMKYDALKRMGVTEGTRNDQVLAKEAGESRNTIQRYIRLTYLMDELLQMVDDGKVPKNTAAELSYIQENEQRQLLTIMLQCKCVPSGNQALLLKELSKAGNWSEEQVWQILQRNEVTYKISLKDKELRKYFPKEYTAKQMEETIIMLLKEWNAASSHKL